MSDQLEALGAQIRAACPDGVTGTSVAHGELRVDAHRGDLLTLMRTLRDDPRFAFVQLSDTSGVYEATVFSEVLATSREYLEAGQAVMITADVHLQDELPKLLCASVKPLDDAVAQAAAGLRIFVADPQTLPSLKSILDRQGRGRGKVSLVLDVGPAREVEVKIPGAWAINAAARAAIKAIPGVVDVHDV